MIVYHLTNSQTGKISFFRHEKIAKTFSSNWKPFGFRSADAHTRTRVRAGGGVEPAARSSHKPPDAQKEAAKKPRIARREARSAGTCANRVRTDRRAALVRSRSAAAVLCPRYSALLLLCRMEQPRTRCKSAADKSAAASAQTNGGDRRSESKRDRFHFHLYDFCFIFRG